MPIKCVIVNCSEGLVTKLLLQGWNAWQVNRDFIKKMLQIFLKKVDGYVRNHIDFVTKMSVIANKNQALTTFDFSNNWTKIDINLE